MKSLAFSLIVGLVTSVVFFNQAIAQEDPFIPFEQLIQIESDSASFAEPVRELSETPSIAEKVTVKLDINGNCPSAGGASCNAAGSCTNQLVLQNGTTKNCSGYCNSMGAACGCRLIMSNCQ